MVFLFDETQISEEYTKKADLINSHYWFSGFLKLNLVLSHSHSILTIFSNLIVIHAEIYRQNKDATSKKTR